MWWLPLQQIISPLWESIATLYRASLDRMIYEFIFLGIIPGTDMRVTFNAVLLVGLALSVMLLIRAHSWRRHTAPEATSLDFIAL